MISRSIDRYFSGEALIGEDFNAEEVDRWYAEEKEAYKDVGWVDADSGSDYPYHALNTICGYNHLSKGRFSRVLGIGSAHGVEFLPILSRVDRLLIVESDHRYWKTSINGTPCTYLSPNASGDLPIESASVDLLTCFGVLHHMAKVSSALTEFSRVLAPNGIALIREPIVSLGDWRSPRSGLTKNERGIPLNIFHSLIDKAGLKVQRRTLVAHAAIGAVARRLGGSFWSGAVATTLDISLCRLYRDVRYHRTTSLQKLTPTSAFFVLCRR